MDHPLRTLTFAMMSLFALVPRAMAEAPAIVPLQGMLFDTSDNAVDGPHRLTFYLYDEAAAGTQLYVDDWRSVDVDHGRFVVYLGSQVDSPLDLAIFRDHSEVWIEVVIDGDEIVQPRTQLGSVPYAGMAQACGDAQTLGGRPPQALAPAGALMPFAGSSAPDGWLLADGAEVSRQAYSELFTAVGTTYGAGDGSTTFNLPDLRGRTAVGAGTGAGLSERGLGASFGSETHTLTVAELPPHTHSGTTGSGNSMSYRVVNSGNGAGTNTAPNHVQGWGGGAYTDYSDANYSLAVHTHDFTTNSGAGLQGSAHPIVPPSIALNYIIKY